ncbi:MAG: hybrid sensor histidine kinase/response regulator [Oculatellaceae cyanobacterium Prado106]|nr:hybrid sensor histidine kinase/response regulator [Oculatellaceae cyanobacterium Prado106]
MLVFDPAILDQGYQFFVQESPEFLKILEEGLLCLRRGYERGEVDALIQAALAIEKGADQVDLQDIRTIAHQFAAILRTLRDQAPVIDENLEGLLLWAYDCLRSPLMQEIRSGHHDSGLTLQTAESVFAHLEDWFREKPEPELLEPFVMVTENNLFEANLAESESVTTLQQEDWHDTLADLEDLLSDAPVPGSMIHPVAEEASIARQFLEGNAVDRATASPFVAASQPADLQQSQQTSEKLRNEPPELVERLSDRLKTAHIYPTPHLSNTIRVDLYRLEKLNNLIGELFIQETGAVLQIQQLADRLNAMSKQFQQFQQFTQKLHRWSYRSQKNKAKLQNSFFLTSPASDFDPLQMDSYNHLYTLAQSMMEEIAQLGEAMQDTTLLCQQAKLTQNRRKQTVKQIQGSLLRSRMFPIGEILQRFPRMLRDLSTQYHKQVSLKIIGEQTLMDKAVLEKLLDPMVHLVRNAFDHGIELPAVRESQGKPAQATIEIRAYHRGNQTFIEVQDDGKGIDVEAVRAKVVALNWLSPQEAAELSSDRLYEYLFSPGFSTAAKVSELSGRGVGLDVVKEQIKALKGNLTLTSEPGKGTRFTLRLPLTLTIAKLLIFSLDNQIMAIPVDALVAIVTAPTHEIEMRDDQSFYHWREDWVPLCPASSLLHPYMTSQNRNLSLQSIPLPLEDKIPLLIVAYAGQKVALQVDQILQEQELIIKPFGRAVKAPAHLYGCTILGDGALVPVIDSQGLITPSQTSFLYPPVPPSAVAKPRIPTILVVDDSLTVRQSLAFTLEKSGYRVLQARDGREGITQLQQESGIQAVFCDVEMPRMNGFEFLNQCRQEFGDAAPPIIMLTSRSGDKHRQTAQELGASGYLTKPYLEQDLLKTLQNLVVGAIV